MRASHRASPRGKGFTGVIKRHGLPRRARHARIHVPSGPRLHRRIGVPVRVFKGHEACAGHMGNERVTIQNLRVVGVEPEKNLLLVRGAVPGANERLVVSCAGAVKKSA